MNAVGIDVSKGKSMIAVVRPFGEVVVTPYEVRHTASELRELAHSLKSLDGETRVILEHTGRYYEPVAQTLCNAGIFVSTEAINQLGSVSRAVEVLRAEMNRLAQQLPEYPVVMSLFGVGPSLGPQLMPEIGDVRRFAHRGSLTAFAGVDPMLNQSGKQESRSNPSSKRGFPYLRRSLFLVMTVLLQKTPSDDPVYQFLDKKRAEGKPYYVYMTAGTNKFLRIYYGKVREHLASLDETVQS